MNSSVVDRDHHQSRCENVAEFGRPGVSALDDWSPADAQRAANLDLRTGVATCVAGSDQKAILRAR